MRMHMHMQSGRGPISAACDMPAVRAQGGEFERWEWRRPHSLASLEDDGKREQLMGPHVTSHEHFFTVLVAVNVFQVSCSAGYMLTAFVPVSFVPVSCLVAPTHRLTPTQLNEMLRDTRAVDMYALYYCLFYGVLANSIRYAARFNDDDATHKLLWSAYQFGFLMMLEV